MQTKQLKQLKRTDGACVRLKRLASRSVSVAHDQNVINAIIPGAEGVSEDTDGAEDDLGIITGRLIGGRSVKVPLG